MLAFNGRFVAERRGPDGHFAVNRSQHPDSERRPLLAGIAATPAADGVGAGRRLGTRGRPRTASSRAPARALGLATKLRPRPTAPAPPPGNRRLDAAAGADTREPASRTRRDGRAPAIVRIAAPEYRRERRRRPRSPRLTARPACREPGARRRGEGDARAPGASKSPTRIADRNGAGRSRRRRRISRRPRRSSPAAPPRLYRSAPAAPRLRASRDRQVPAAEAGYGRSRSESPRAAPAGENRPVVSRRTRASAAAERRRRGAAHRAAATSARPRCAASGGGRERSSERPVDRAGHRPSALDVRGASGTSAARQGTKAAGTHGADQSCLDPLSRPAVPRVC